VPLALPQLSGANTVVTLGNVVTSREQAARVRRPRLAVDHDLLHHLPRSASAQAGLRRARMGSRISIEAAEETPASCQAGERAVTAADLDAGRHVVTWDGMGGRGDPVPAGVYLVVLESCGELRREKVVVGR